MTVWFSRRRRADVYASTTRRRRDARRELRSLVSNAVPTQVVVVDREDAKDVDARFLYRAVPVGTLSTNPTLASSFNLSPKAKTKKREQALAAHLSAASGKKALTKKLLDIGALVAARGILAKGDVAAACAVAKQRRTDPAAVLPAKVRAAVEAWLATVSGG